MNNIVILGNKNKITEYYYTMRRFIPLIFISLLSFSSIAQEEPISKIEWSVEDWTSLRTESNVLIEYRFINCEAQIGYDKEMIQLRFTNSSTQQVNVNWHLYLYYNGICKTCDFPQEYTYTLSLMPGQVLTGDCALESDHQLKIFSKFTDANYKGGSILTDFELHNLKITTIQ